MVEYSRGKEDHISTKGRKDCMKKENISLFLCAFLFGFTVTSIVGANKKTETLKNNIKLLEGELESVEETLLFHAARLDDAENSIRGLEEREQ